MEINEYEIDGLIQTLRESGIKGNDTINLFEFIIFLKKIVKVFPTLILN